MEDIPKVKGRLNSLAESDYPFTCPIVKGEILFGIVRLPDGKRRRDLKQKANELFAQVPCDSNYQRIAGLAIAYAQIGRS